jgi:hypothetical protein
MAIRGDSYSTIAEVEAMTKHLLDGEATFNSETRPTKTEVEKFIDRASGVLNNAFGSAGYAPANVTANSTAKLVADEWVTSRAVEWVESTQRGAGFSHDDNPRGGLSSDMAHEAVMQMRLGFARMGLTVSDPVHQGLTYTAFDEHDERADPDSTTLEQPIFRRRQFDA